MLEQKGEDNSRKNAEPQRETRFWKSPLPVAVAQVFFRVDDVADALFQQFDLRKAAVGLAIPDGCFAHPDTEPAGDIVIGPQCHFSQALSEGLQQFLSVPGRAQQPAALGAVVDFDARTE